jgi:D-alanyl-D-alanine dipeptidase
MRRIFVWFRLTLLTLVVAGIVTSCKKDPKMGSSPETAATLVVQKTKIDFDTTLWTELKAQDGYLIDIKYATKDNFVKEVIYPCARMFLRPEVAIALAKVNAALLSKGYKLKLFDGYRPKPAQQKLWDKVPDRNYVAPPWEGSMHNRGVAIDLTLADLQGKEIDMGTPYDFFGPRAHRDFQELPEQILKHRQLLRSVMESHGFQSIRTEWWHYSYTKGSYPLDDWQWACTK